MHDAYEDDFEQEAGSPFQIGDVVALAMKDHTCHVGQIERLDDTWITLALMSWLSGEFGFEVHTYRVDNIEKFLIANLMPHEEARERGWVVSESSIFYDMDPLARLQNEWGRARKPPQPASMSPADPVAPRTAGGSPAESPIAKPWKRQSLEQLLSDPAPPWVIKDYIRAAQVGFLIAAPTVGKSTLAAAWIHCIIYGKAWCGHPTMGGSIIALVGEGRRGFARRLDAFRRHHDLGPIPNGRYLEIVDFKEPLSGSKGQAEAKRLVATVAEEQGRPPAVVLIDTLSSHWADSEDSAEFGAPAMRALADIADEFKCAVVVVHHTTKSKGRQTMPELNDCRGSGTFIGNSDYVFAMCATTRGDGAVLKALKLKDDDAPPQVKLTRISVPCGHDEDGAEATAAVFVNASATVTDEDDPDAKEDRGLNREIQAIVSAMSHLGTATKKDAVIAQAHMGVVRGRAVFDIALSRGFIHNTGTESRPKYSATDAGKALATAAFDHPIEEPGDADGN